MSGGADAVRRRVARVPLAIAAAVALSCAACSGDSGGPAEPSRGGPASRAIAALVSFDAPKGFTMTEYANNAGADPVVAFSNGLDRITVRAFGAAGSDYETPARYLSGPAASTMGRAPTTIGTVKAAGRELVLYEHGFPIHLGDPHVPSAPVTLGREIFCVLPAAGGRFVVLAWAVEAPIPDPNGRGEDAWDAFVRSVRLVDAPP